MTAHSIDWRSQTQTRISRGRLGKRPGSLAGLHEARRQHLGQFFTPVPLAQWIWRMLGPVLDAGRREGEVLPILDNSVGAGALLAFADPAKHLLAGIDVDAETIDALSEDAKAAGFVREFSAIGMENCRPCGFAAAVINPPFSLHLESPNLVPGFATTYGRFGPDTSALSHVYALQQALDAAEVVGAIVPRTYAATILDEPAAWPRLAGVVHAPPRSFRSEGTDVDVSVLFFDAVERPGRAVTVVTLDPEMTLLPALGLGLAPLSRAAWDLRETGIEASEPTITRAVTGDRRVRIAHNGRKIVLGFRCGFTEAKVRNAVLRARLVPTGIEGHRYPRGVRYTGQGALDLEVHLVQDDPLASLRELVELIGSVGAEPQVDPGLERYLAKRARRADVECTPFRHTVFVKGDASGGAATLKATARKTHLVEPQQWGSPVIKAGSEIAFEMTTQGDYRYSFGGRDFTIPADALDQRFTVSSRPEGDRWVTVHAGRLDAFPDRCAALKRQAEALGIDRFLTWDYQFDDLIELSMARHGIAAWAVGLGKARLAVALVLMSGCKTGLIATESYLIGEMKAEIAKLDLDPKDWQVIERPGQLVDLKRINIISYNRLRGPIARGHARRTYAAALRHRVGIMVADEGDLLRNRNTAQTAAIRQISAKRRYLLTGTPNGNYPKDAFSLIGFTGGDATACQAYGMRRWFLTPELRRSTLGSVPGLDEIRERFVTVEWQTHEWKEDMTAGAKREVPKLRNLPLYREAIAHHIKRRVAQEPDVKKHFSVPVPTHKVTSIDWDDAHLAHYLQVAEEFRNWYLEGKNVGRERNLIALLARIQAVQLACSIPQRHKEGAPFLYRGGMTSKQRYACDTLESLSANGHKTIAYAEWPDMLELLGRELEARGVEAVILHGGKSIGERTALLDRRFRNGPAPVLLASTGVMQRGMNIPQADWVLFLTRSWTAKTEQQAEGRVLRPQQTRPVTTEFLELKGSIDSYQRQMVEHKADAICAGLDWGAPTLDEVAFVHLDSILHRFVDDLATSLGCRSYEVRERLIA